MTHFASQRVEEGMYEVTITSTISSSFETKTSYMFSCPFTSNLGSKDFDQIVRCLSGSEDWSELGLSDPKSGEFIVECTSDTISFNQSTRCEKIITSSVYPLTPEIRKGFLGLFQKIRDEYAERGL